MGERISFTRPSAERIANAVRAVEQARPEGAALGFRRQDAVPNAKVFRVATFTGAWGINASKVVRLVENTAATVLAKNITVGVSPAAGARCFIARDGTSWSSIGFDLTQQPGYSTGGTQVLTIVNGNLRWIGTTACA